MKIVQVKGSNASGKSTIARQLLDLSAAKTTLFWLSPKIGGHKTVYATIAEDIGWAVIGEYKPESKMGGCDGMKTVQEVKQAILDTKHIRSDLYGVMFEGMMISTIMSTFYDFLLALKSPTVEPMFVILRTDLDGCLRRLSERGTMKPGLKTQNIADKCAIVLKGAARYDQRYVRYMDVDRIPKHRMAKEFLRCVGDTELLEQLG